MAKENTQSGMADAQANAPDQVRGRPAAHKPHARKSVRSQGGSHVTAKQAPVSKDASVEADESSKQPAKASPQSAGPSSQSAESSLQSAKLASIDLSNSLPKIELPDSEAGEGQDEPSAEPETPSAEPGGVSEEEEKSASDAEERDEAEDEEAPKDKKKRKRLSVNPGTIRIVVFALIAFLVLAAIAWASFFAWNRWGRYDDHADIQGEWYVEGTAALVTIDENAIHLDEHVAYAYELNEHDKTIRFSFGSWEGQGRYRFSDDRRHLLVIDGEFDGMGNLFDDLFQPFDEMAIVGSRSALATGGEVANSLDSTEAVPAGSGESASSSSQTTSSTGSSAGASSSKASETENVEVGVSLFSRDPDPAALEAKEAAEKAAKEKAEQEAKKAKAEEEAEEEEEYVYYDSSEEDENAADGTEEEQSSDEEEEWDEGGSEEEDA